MPIKTTDWERGAHVGGYSVVIDVRTPAEWQVPPGGGRPAGTRPDGLSTERGACVRACVRVRARQDDHIPGAINLPVLDHDQRHQVRHTHRRGARAARTAGMGAGRTPPARSRPLCAHAAQDTRTVAYAHAHAHTRMHMRTRLG